MRNSSSPFESKRFHITFKITFSSLGQSGLPCPLYALGPVIKTSINCTHMLRSLPLPTRWNHPRPSCVSVPFCTLFPVLRMPFPHSPSPFPPGLSYRMDFWTRNLGTDGCPALTGSLHSCPLRKKLASVLLVSGFLEHPAVGSDEFSRSSLCRQAGQLSAPP